MSLIPKHPWQLTWFPALLFVSVAVTLICGARMPRRPPQSVADVVNRLRESGMQVHVVMPVPKDITECSGAYLCLRQRTWGDIAGLRRTGKYASAWKGVLHVDRCPNEETAEGNLPDWGPHGARVGGVLLFGDRDMLRRAVTVLQD
jgi:hypothetical protein